VIRTLCTAVALIGLLTLPVAADDDKPAIDAKTMEILKKVGTLYKDAKSLQADLAIEGTREIDGQDKREVRAKGTIAMKRPNLIAIRTTANNDPNMGVDVVGDGKNLFIHGRRLKQYTERKAPEKLVEIGRIILPLGSQNTGMLFQNVLAEDPTDQLLEGVTEGKLAGTEKVGGKEAHHLRFKQPNLDWEIWVPVEGEPFVVKARSLMELPNGRLFTVETYSNWKLNPEIAKDVFEFKPPEESKKVDRLGGQRDGGQ
jgi:hypothetical protein